MEKLNDFNRLVKIYDQIQSKKISSSEIMNTNLYEMKNEILDTVTSDMSLIERARKLYIEMNKRFSYDPNYLGGTDLEQSIIYNKYASFDQIDSTNIICKSWSELYRELLIDSGFELNTVSIKSTGEGVGMHRWVEINFGDRIIVADATESIGGTNDLANCKIGSSTLGFVETMPEYSGVCLTKYDLDSLKEEGKSLLDMDKKIGYVNDDNYFEELIIDAKKQFGNDTDLNNAVFGSDSSSQFLKIMLEADMDSGMDGLDAFIYYKKLRSALFGGNSTYGITTKYNIKTVDGSKEVFATLETSEGYAVYSKSTGKHVFYDIEDYINYIDQFS